MEIEARPIPNLVHLLNLDASRDEASPERVEIVDLNAEVLGRVTHAPIMGEQMQLIVAQTIPDEVEVGDRLGDWDLVQSQNAPVESAGLAFTPAGARYADML